MEPEPQARPNCAGSWLGRNHLPSLPVVTLLSVREDHDAEALFAMGGSSRCLGPAGGHALGTNIYTNSWVSIPGGPAVADSLANKHDFFILGQISASTTTSGMER